MTLADSDQTQLLEIFRSSAAKSTEKLAAVSGMPWDIHIISLDVGAGARFLPILARDKREYLGAVFSNPGEKYLVLFSEDSGRTLLDASLRGRRLPPRAEQSALTEIANILINGLSGALADRQGMIRVLSAPTLARGTKAAIFEEAFGARFIDETIVDVLIHISSPRLAADCTVMLRLDTLSANFLLNAEPGARGAFTAD